MFDQIITIIITTITVLGSSQAFRYYQKKIQLKHKEKVKKYANQSAFTDNLKDRISKMEEGLQDCIVGREKMQIQLLELTAEVSTLRERVKHLEKENERLKNLN